MSKSKWIRPILTILARGKPGNSALSQCKYWALAGQSVSLGPEAGYDDCFITSDPDREGTCGGPCHGRAFS